MGVDDVKCDVHVLKIYEDWTATASLNIGCFFVFYERNELYFHSQYSLMTTKPLEQVGEDEEVITQEPTKVILYNDDVHAFDEVITQIIKAIKCTSQHAESLAWDVHNNGKAVVYTGELVKCMEVSSVLEEIKLMTEIEV